MNKIKAAIVIGISCIILTIAIIVQLNTVKSSNSVVGVQFNDSELRDQVLRAKEKYDNTTKELDIAEKELAKVRESSTANNSELEQTEEQIKLNNNLLGLTKLQGQGVEVTLKDDPNATPETVGVFEDISNHIVHYYDVMYIVNELKNAGAEAISVNGQRIVNTTSITCVGNVIKVNDEKVGSPFVIKAIGFPEMLASSLTKGGGYLQYINGYIVTDVKKLDKVQIPKYTGAFQSKYMKTVQ